MHNKFDSFKKFLENSNIISDRIGTSNGLQLQLGKYELFVFIKECQRSGMPSILTEINEQYDSSLLAMTQLQITNELKNANQDFIKLINQEIDQKFKEILNKPCQENEKCLNNSNNFCAVIQIDKFFLQLDPNNLKQITDRIDYNVNKYKPEALMVGQWAKNGIWTYVRYYHTPGEIDWRPTDTVPEDFYSA